MKRIGLEMLTLLLIVSIGTALLKQPEDERSLEDKLEAYEQTVEDGVIYRPEKEVQLLQTEENVAGKLGRSASRFIVSVITSSVEILTGLWNSMF